MVYFYLLTAITPDLDFVSLGFDSVYEFLQYLLKKYNIILNCLCLQST